MNTSIALPRNVQLWDAWDRQALPGFLVGLDIFWMPFIKNELNESMCPIKLFEVLSAGLAIVCTDLDESRDAGGKLLEYATSADEHITAIERALKSDGPKLRKARAEAVCRYDWSARMTVFAKLLLG